MKSALYGRMRQGRCVAVDLGYIGCSSNVLAHLDSECTGKEKCEILVISTHIQVTDGCISGLERYLEVDYECKPGIQFTLLLSTYFVMNLHIDEDIMTI